MSQSDYIQFKKTSRQLKDLAKMPSVLWPSFYTQAVSYNFETTVPNTKVVYHQLVPPNRQIIFDMERAVTSCPTFLYCKDTHARVNRKPLTRGQISPKPRPKYIKDPVLFSKKYTMKCSCKDTRCVCKALCPCKSILPIVAPKACAI
jgi:hypothetical protein